MTATSEVQAGRELDALVAEKVMNYTKVDRDGTWYALMPQGISKAGHVPKYSTDIAAAWEVVEKLSKYPTSLVFVVCQPHDGNLPSCMVYHGGARSYGPRDVFLHLGFEDKWTNSAEAKALEVMPAIRVQAESVPLAICRAALKAVGA